ncbi:MAG TPA: hypothetical protein VK421_03195 [Pyrinomonadaceae bacterium]|nr:hypothetical protein [Pyrinomonadaceae bacterium]
MSRRADSAGRLSTIDLLFSLLDDQRRPFDFTLIFHLRESPGVEALRAGAASARNFYPTTGSRVVNKRWVRFDEPGEGLTAVSVPDGGDAATRIEEFVDAPLDLREQTPARQLLITDGTGAGAKLVTRFHHAAADGLSAAMWLGHQLRVAYGEQPPAAEASPFETLPLRTHPSPVRRSRFAHDGPSDRLWSPGTRPSRTRRWLTIGIAAAELRAGCRRVSGFTYNDLLAACALELFLRWNREHGAGRGQKVGLWLPVNIRRRPSAGFGNGTSRVRLYPRYAGAAPLADKCREVRRQLSWCLEHGEWAVPERSPLTSLPSWAARPLLRAYAGRPGVDMATAVFSHAERWAGPGGEIFRHVEKIECVGQLHARHRVNITGATHAGRTWLTFTYDPGLLPPEDARRLAGMYEEQIELARRELV